MRKQINHAIPNKNENVFSAKRRQVYHLSGIGLKMDRPQRMDGLELLKKLPNGAVPLVFFDPQYSGAPQFAKCGHSARQQRRWSLSQMNGVAINRFVGEIDRVLCPSGHLMFWVDKYILLNNIRQFMAGSGLKLVDMIVWDKGKMGLGHRSRHISEFLLVFQKPPVRVKGGMASA